MKVVDGTRSDTPEMSLEFGKRHLNRVQVRAVGGQKQEPASGLFQAVCGSGAFVRGQIIQYDNIAGVQRRCQLRLDINLESGLVHRPVQDPWRDHLILAQAGNEGLCLPVPKRRGILQALALDGAATQAMKLCIDGGFINEDQPVQVLAHKGLASPFPVLTPGPMPGAHSLAGEQRLFYMCTLHGAVNRTSLMSMP